MRRRTPTMAALMGVVVAACGGQPDLPNEEIGAAVQRGVGNRNFGIHCTSYYDGGWRYAQPSAWDICDGLWTTLDNEATAEFYYDLVGKKYYWEYGGDGADNSLEDVDLFFGFTDAAATTVNAKWAMFNDGEWAVSSNMGLGNERRGTSIFATYSSSTMKIDSYTWNRWDSVFNGGLRIALGSHGLLYSGSAEEDVAKVFAQYLNAGYSFTNAWAAGFDLTIYNNQDVAVLATGTGSSNCSSRRDNLSWDNFSYSSFPRLSGSSIGTWCGWIWDNI